MPGKLPATLPQYRAGVDAPVIPGAEAWSAAGDPAGLAGDPAGVLVVHGFTGTPATVSPVAEALAAAGFAVEAPRLPGHGTTIEDMIPTRFADWSSALEATYLELAARCSGVAVVGLSMGATLTCWLSARHPEIAGIACINPMVAPAEPALLELIGLMVDAGETVSEGVGADLADPDAREIAYDGSPLAPARSLYEALELLQDDLSRITCPVLILTSTQDHVVHPDNSDHLAAHVTGPVERVRLERSYHVATLDHDKDLVAERVVAFAQRVTS
ncbi:MAG: alpha/beta fold hydrolase [Actinomycetota bacterium]|nr:alpha/beta fold hydrolase [Actinomycetota bacterium]